MTNLTINDLQHTDELDSSAMARVIGGEKTLKDLPKDKPIKLELVNGDIIGTWANGTTMSIPLE
ncbi:MAG: hypothetical protein Q8Q81_19605 [Oxalobacteraceae bacterium]|nr:hypothetical protein [Oxalobacteraceae bacterium]